jgi:DNA-binding GntR family transcriptional regulator
MQSKLLPVANAQITTLSLHREVYERLRRRIEDQILKPGDRIDENALVREFGVSRTPLREALKVLQVEGLVTMSPHRGCFVATLSQDDLDDIYAAISALEGSTARAAAHAVSPADLEKLRDMQTRMESAAAVGDYAAYRVVNRKAHELLQSIAANRWLTDIVANLRRVLMLHRHVTIYIPERLDQSVAEHRELLAAFEAGDADAAERVMRAHVMNQREALRKLHRTNELSEEKS